MTVFMPTPAGLIPALLADLIEVGSGQMDLLMRTDMDLGATRSDFRIRAVEFPPACVATASWRYAPPAPEPTR